MNKLFENKAMDLKPYKEVIDANLKISYQDKDVLLLYRFLDEKKRCSGCRGLAYCKQDSSGYAPVLDTEKITVSYKECKYKKVETKNNRKTNFIETIYLPKKILEANLTNFYCSTELRKKAYNYAVNFCSTYKSDNYVKGMYLFGKFGLGKTYLLAAIANELAQRNIRTVLIYFPDLARELKNSIDSGTLEEKINFLKTVDVLMLDDLGSEMLTLWLRDEILGPILQYRVLDSMPVFISSNYEYLELFEYQLCNIKGETDEVNGGRILTRIKKLTEPFELDAYGTKDGK